MLSVCPGPVAEVGPLAALDVEAPGGGGRGHHLAAREAEQLLRGRHPPRLVHVVVELHRVARQHHEPATISDQEMKTITTSSSTHPSPM